MPLVMGSLQMAYSWFWALAGNLLNMSPLASHMLEGSTLPMGELHHPHDLDGLHEVLS